MELIAASPTTASLARATADRLPIEHYEIALRNSERLLRQSGFGLDCSAAREGLWPIDRSDPLSPPGFPQGEREIALHLR